MDAKMQALIDAPLANPGKLNLPEGRRPIERGRKVPAPDGLTPAQVKERKAKEAADKLAKLLDYYATTDLPAEKVARDIGLSRMVEDGVDEDTGKVKFKRVLDVEKAEAELAWRRSK